MKCLILGWIFESLFSVKVFCWKLIKQYHNYWNDDLCNFYFFSNLIDNQIILWPPYFTCLFLGEIDEDDKALEALLQTQTLYSTGRVRIPDWYYKSFLSHPKVTGLRKTEDSRNNFVGYLGKLRGICTNYKNKLLILIIKNRIKQYGTVYHFKKFWWPQLVQGPWDGNYCAK